MVSCKSLQRVGDLLSSSSPLKGLGHFQATWAVPRPPAVCVMVTHGTLPGGGLALGLACLGRTWTQLRVSQDGVAVTTPPKSRQPRSVPVSGPPHCCSSTQVSWGPRPRPRGQPHGSGRRKGTLDTLAPAVKRSAQEGSRQLCSQLAHWPDCHLLCSARGPGSAQKTESLNWEGTAPVTSTLLVSCVTTGQMLSGPAFPPLGNGEKTVFCLQSCHEDQVSQPVSAQSAQSGSA